MNVITVSKMREKLSDTITSAVNGEAISIQKNNQDVAVLISSQRYKELKRIEDLLYKKAADLAFSEGFATDEEVADLESRLSQDA